MDDDGQVDDLPEEAKFVPGSLAMGWAHTCGIEEETHHANCWGGQANNQAEHQAPQQRRTSARAKPEERARTKGPPNQPQARGQERASFGKRHSPRCRNTSTKRHWLCKREGRRSIIDN